MIEITRQFSNIKDPKTKFHFPLITASRLLTCCRNPKLKLSPPLFSKIAATLILLATKSNKKNEKLVTWFLIASYREYQMRQKKQKLGINSYLLLAKNVPDLDSELREWRVKSGEWRFKPTWLDPLIILLHTSSQYPLYYIIKSIQQTKTPLLHRLKPITYLNARLET